MPHSIFGTRGQVRFRGKNSPKWTREAHQKERDALTRSLLAEAKQLRAEIAAAKDESEKGTLRKAFDKVKGLLRGGK